MKSVVGGRNVACTVTVCECGQQLWLSGNVKGKIEKKIFSTFFTNLECVYVPI